jgi:hypothetical protein
MWLLSEACDDKVGRGLSLGLFIIHYT